MIGGFTVNSLFIAQTAYIVLVACGSTAVCKADKLIQTVICVCFGLTVCRLSDLVAVSIIGINCLLCGAACSRHIVLRSLYFLLEQCGVLALSVGIAVLGNIIFITCCRHFWTVAVIVILVCVGISRVVSNLDFFLCKSFQTVILVIRCFYYTTFITLFASVRTIKIIWIFVAWYGGIALFVYDICYPVGFIVGICRDHAVCKRFCFLVAVCIIAVWNGIITRFNHLGNSHLTVILIFLVWVEEKIILSCKLMIYILWHTFIEVTTENRISAAIWFNFFIFSAERVIDSICGKTAAYWFCDPAHAVIGVGFRNILRLIVRVYSFRRNNTIQCIVSISCNIAVSVCIREDIAIKIVSYCSRIVACAVGSPYGSHVAVVLIVCGEIGCIALIGKTCVHLYLYSGIVVEVFWNILFAVCSTVAESYLFKKSHCVVLIVCNAVLCCAPIFFLNSLLCENDITVLVILVFCYRLYQWIERSICLSDLIQRVVFIFCCVVKCICLTGKLSVCIVRTYSLCLTVSFFYYSIASEICKRFIYYLLVSCNIGGLSGL